MKSDTIILTLIKEVVKTEVKKQVKEEITRLIKSGQLSVPNKSTASKPIQKSPSSITESVSQEAPVVYNSKTFSKNPLINNILNSTKPFTKAERAEGGMLNESSVLDLIKPTQEGEWKTMRMTTDNLVTNSMPNLQSDTHQQEEPKTDVEVQKHAVAKALTRDYRDLVKRFK